MILYGVMKGRFYLNRSNSELKHKMKSESGSVNFEPTTQPCFFKLIINYLINFLINKYYEKKTMSLFERIHTQNGLSSFVI